MNRRDLMKRMAGVPFLWFLRPGEDPEPLLAPVIHTFEQVPQHYTYDRPGGVPAIQKLHGRPLFRWKVEGADSLRIVRLVRDLRVGDLYQVTVDTFVLNPHDTEGEVEWPWPEDRRQPAPQITTHPGQVIIFENDLRRYVEPLYHVLEAENEAGVTRRIIERAGVEFVDQTQMASCYVRARKILDDDDSNWTAWVPAGETIK